MFIFFAVVALTILLLICSTDLLVVEDLLTLDLYYQNSFVV